MKRIGFVDYQLDFFDHGQPAIDGAQSLMVRRILDAADDPRARQEFIPL